MLRSLLSVLVAAGSAVHPSPASVRARTPEQAIALVEGIARIVDGDKMDCGKMAADLDKYFQANATLIKNLQQEQKRLTPAERKTFSVGYRERLIAAQKKVSGGMQKCGSDAGVARSLKELLIQQR